MLLSRRRLWKSFIFKCQLTRLYVYRTRDRFSSLFPLPLKYDRFTYIIWRYGLSQKKTFVVEKRHFFFLLSLRNVVEKIRRLRNVRTKRIRKIIIIILKKKSVIAFKYSVKVISAKGNNCLEPQHVPSVF